LAQRQLALKDVMRNLNHRNPPMYNKNIDQPSELRDTMMYDAIERLYRHAMTLDNDVFAIKQKIYTKKFKNKILNLQPTTTNDTRDNVFSIKLKHR
jgi:hypothetical protein